MNILFMLGLYVSIHPMIVWRPVIALPLSRAELSVEITLSDSIWKIAPKGLRSV